MRGEVVAEKERGDHPLNLRGGAAAKPGFQDLIAWQKAMELVTAVYGVTREWPREEQYGLISQIRRAAVAIPSNLAEGHGRSGPREYAHHVSIAFGSLCELETQMLIGERLGYTNGDVTAELMTRTAEVRRLIRGLIRSLQSPTSAMDLQ
jgi:four helix bundle protein